MTFKNISIVCECLPIINSAYLWDNCSAKGEIYGNSPGQIVNIVLLVSAVILLIYFILKDAVKGLRSRAQWIPGDFLVLSALTIQLLNLISTQGEPLNWKAKGISLNEFWMIHTSRVLLCVVIGYLMPGMANPGAEDYWGKIMALALTVFLHVISELYIINPSDTGSLLKSIWPKQQNTSIRLYYILAALMLSSFLFLLLLLAGANIAGRGIERILAEKIPVILNGRVKEDHDHPHRHSYEGLWRAEEDHHHHSRCKECWHRVEVAVLRAWIVARAYSLEYIIARSALAASAAAIVTSQIAITVMGGVWRSPKLLLCNPHDKLRFGITMLQCMFILIGWSMIGWRWATAVAYYGDGSSCLPIEDFWTRHLIELQEAKESRLQQAELLDAKIEKLVVNALTKVTPPRLLLYPVIWLQWFTVSLSKACWLGSQILIRNKLTDKILLKRKKDYADYQKILEGVQMLGESPESLWLSNRKSIPLAVDLISRRPECQHLVQFLAAKRTSGGLGLRCLEANKKPQTGLKYLCKIRPIEGTQQPQQEQFTDRTTKPWKLTAVALLSIIVQLSRISAETDKEQASTSRPQPPKVVTECLVAYSQAWEIIDFVEKADREADGISSEEADGISSEAADKYFGNLKKKVRDWPSKASPPASVTAALAGLKKESKSKTETLGCANALGLKRKEKTQGDSNRWTGNDSIDWKAAAWGSAVYKLCNSIECNEGTDVNELLKELESSLADIINDCLEKIQRLLLVNSRKWAINSDEKRIAKALFTTGKARTIMVEERSGSAIVPHQG